MKRPTHWLQAALVICLALVVGEFVALEWLAPRYVLQSLERLSGGTLLVQRAHLSFPLTTTLTGVHLASNTAEAAFSIPRVVIRPRWCSIARRTFWLDAVEMERPLLRLTRTADGTILRPAIREPGEPASRIGSPRSAPWRVHINSLSITDATVEFLDKKPAMPFHGVLDHVSFVIGPVAVASNGTGLGAVPMERAGMSFAIRGMVVGYGGVAAPAYCSGWLDPAVKDLQASCRLEPLPLAAFEPYYHGPSELRVYAVMLTSTSQWSARSNQFTGRVQVELSNLKEGDFSVHGRTIVDVKKMANGQETRLSGVMSVSGPWDNPKAWQAEFLPGDERVQDLVKRLLEHGVTAIKIPLGSQPMRISVAPSTQATMTDIETASREVQEALEILAAPDVPTPPPAGASEPGAAGAPAVAAPLPAVPFVSTPPATSDQPRPAPETLSTQAPPAPPPQPQPVPETQPSSAYYQP